MMGGIPFSVIAAILVLTFSNEVQGTAGSNTIRQNCSIYTFYKNSKSYPLSWSYSIKLCEKTGSHLVSIESREEWSFLNRTIQTMETKEYFIGLKKDKSAGEWRWISDNSTVNATIGTWPWAPREPSTYNRVVEYCVVMFKEYPKYQYGLYNNVQCNLRLYRAGYICERAVDCNGEEEMTTEPVTTEKKPVTNTESSTGLLNTQTLPVTKVIHSIISTTQKQSTNGLPTIVIYSRVIPTENNNCLTEKATSGRSYLIQFIVVVVILALVILIMLLVLGVLFVRQRRSLKKQVDNRVRYTTSSPGQQSTDHVQLESPAELTGHVIISRTEVGLATYETLNGRREEECAYANLDKTNRASRCDGEKEGAEKQRQFHDGYCVPLEQSHDEYCVPSTVGSYEEA